MRRAWLLVGLLACSKPEKLWMDTHATQLHVGSVEANIPPGWRDYNELVTKPKSSYHLPDGARLILLENNPARARIMVMPMPGAIQGDLCVDAAKVWQEQLGDKGTLSNAESANFNGNKGCLMTLSGPQHGKVMVVTPQGGSSVNILCIGQGPELDEACDKTVYGIHATPAPAK